MAFITKLKQLFTAACLVGAVSSVASAQYIGGDMELNLNEEKSIFIVAGDLTLTGRVDGRVDAFAGDAEINAEITQDLSIAAGDIQISGSIGDDLEAAAADITVDASVTGDADIAGADIVIEGPIGGDISVAGAIVEIKRTAVIGGNLSIAAREAVIDAEVAGLTKARVRELTLGGVFHTDLDIRADSISFSDGTEIHGSIRVKGPKEPTIPDTVTLTGQLDYEYAPAREHDDDWEDFDGVDVDLNILPGSWFLGGMFSTTAFVLGLLAALIAPKSVQHITNSFMRRPWVSSLVGLVVYAFSPIMILLLSVMLVVTVIGIPLAVIVLLAYFPILFLGFAFGAMAIGEMIFKRFLPVTNLGMRILTFFLALALIAALSAVPVLNFIIWTVIFSIGLGAWSFALFTKRDDMSNVTQ